MNTPKTLTQWAILIVIVAAIIAVVWIALTQFGIIIPSWVVKVFWILVLTVVIIAAIKFLAGLNNSPPAV